MQTHHIAAPKRTSLSGKEKTLMNLLKSVAVNPRARWKREREREPKVDAHSAAYYNCCWSCAVLFEMLLNQSRSLGLESQLHILCRAPQHEFPPSFSSPCPRSLFQCSSFLRAWKIPLSVRVSRHFPPLLFLFLFLSAVLQLTNSFFCIFSFLSISFPAICIFSSFGHHTLMTSYQIGCPFKTHSVYILFFRFEIIWLKKRDWNAICIRTVLCSATSSKTLPRYVARNKYRNDP